MIRILHVFGKTGRGGAESMIMNYYRCIDRNQIQFDFVKHTEEECDFDKEIRSLGGRIYNMPKFKGVNYFRYRDAWKKLLILHPEYHIVHVHHFKVAGIVNHIAKETRVPVRIVHAHATKIEGGWFSRAIYQCIMKPLLLKYSNHYWACGQVAGEYMFGKRHFYILRNAIPVEQFRYDEKKREEIRQQLDIKPETFVIGHVGRFSLPKNHKRIIEIFDEIHKQSDNTLLLLVGDGELKASVENMVCSLGISDKVIFVGVRSDVYNILQVVDLFIFPSIYEGLCIAPIEAQASGIPCVLSDVISKEVQLTDLVKFVRLNDSNETWVKTITSLINKKIDRGNYNHMIIQSGYDIHANAKQLAEYYTKMQPA